MADSPIVIDYMQVTVSSAAAARKYQRGQLGVYVLVYVTFGLNGYLEAPQYINFLQQQFYPRNNRFDHFQWQLKPGLSLTFKPIYGNLDALNPTIQGQIINLLAGGVAGLAAVGPAGPGVAPIIVPL